MDFSTIYRPLTSRPFLSDDSYREMVPCRALRPYIACYWISKGSGADAGKKGGEILVIPDTCMDLIIKVDHGSQTVTGYLSALFDRPFTVKEKEADGAVTTFAIRFYFWAAHLFLDLDFKEAHNHTLDLRDLGADWVKLFWQAFDMGDLERQTERIEAFLLKRLFWVEQNSNLFNSIHRIVHTAGNSSVKEICDYCCVSQRQMERIFSKEIGLPLKRMVNLVRYQNVWREMVLSKDFDIHEAVYRFGYTDQAHLLKEFRRFHGTSPKEAVKIAYANR